MPKAQYSSTMIPFEEAIAYHLQKLQLPSETWRDLQGSIHARAFTVAGATNLALLNDLHQAVTAAISNGDTLQDFRKKFDVAVAKYGWSYKGKRGWRTNVIYQNNKNTANAAGRWTQQQRVKGTRPFLLYSTAADTRVRPDHQRWHYYLLPVDHPFWHSHYPPNGWNCRCKVIVARCLNLDLLSFESGFHGSCQVRSLFNARARTGTCERRRGRRPGMKPILRCLSCHLNIYQTD